MQIGLQVIAPLERQKILSKNKLGSLLNEDSNSPYYLENVEHGKIKEIDYEALGNEQATAIDHDDINPKFHAHIEEYTKTAPSQEDETKDVRTQMFEHLMNWGIDGYYEDDPDFGKNQKLYEQQA